MKYLLLILIGRLVLLSGYGQIQPGDSSAKTGLHPLLERGVKGKNGEISYHSPEVTRLLTDSAYRAAVYNGPKTVLEAEALWSNGQFLRAMYLYGIVYETQPAAVMRSLGATRLPAALLSKGAINAFYTYGWFEPGMVSFPHGKFQIDNASRMEWIMTRYSSLANALNNPAAK